MQKNRVSLYVVSVAIILFALIISSCDLSTEGKANEDYRVGKEGIVAGFLKDSPPQKVYAGSPLYIIAEIKNKGAFDNNPSGLGYIYLHGYDRTAMPFEEGAIDANYVKKEIPPIIAKSPYIKEGGYETVTFEVKENYLKVPYGDKYEPTLMLSSCYRYRTIATPTVCIVPDPSLLIKNKVCEPKTIIMTSQGAPVAVTKVEEEIMNGVVNFVITIENVGDGNVVAYNSINDCPFKLDKFDKINTVDVTPSMRGAKLLSCQPGNKIRLVDKRGTIFCKFALSETATYTTQLMIQLDYAYNSNVKRTLQVAKVPGTPSGYMDDPNANIKSGDSGNTGGSSSTGGSGGTDNTGGSSSTGDSGTDSTQTNSGSTETVVQYADCACGGQANCICIEADGKNMVCRNEIFQLPADDNTARITVKPSNSNFKTCGIEGGGSGNCPYTEEIMIYRDGDVGIYGSDANGKTLASDRCTFKLTN